MVISVQIAGGEFVICSRAEVGHRAVESAANARLIAAAPALYEALREVMLHLPDFAEDDQRGIVKACDMARTALAKAGGGS